MLERTSDLDERIYLQSITWKLSIIMMMMVRLYLAIIFFFLVFITADTIVGFSSTMFTATETDGYSKVCIEVYNPPPSVGALHEFSVFIFPGDI